MCSNLKTFLCRLMCHTVHNFEEGTNLDMLAGRNVKNEKITGLNVHQASTYFLLANKKECPLF